MTKLTSRNSEDIVIELKGSSDAHFFVFGLQLSEEPLYNVRHRTCLRHDG